MYINEDCFFIGLSHGHTGHVRFLTSVEMTPGYVLEEVGFQKYVFRRRGRRGKLLVISGGDGYENFNQSAGEAAGRDDSTNHLLLWQVWSLCDTHLIYFYQMKSISMDIVFFHPASKCIKLF